ncbi:MAG: hypothetical protein ACE5FT_07430, partial [Candidatus Nanoarchaeia archaeon]
KVGIPTMKRNTIAKLQVGFGCVLLIFTIFLTKVVLFDIYTGGLVESLNATTISWDEDIINADIIPSTVRPHIISYVTSITHTTKLAGWNFGASMLILGAISIFFILQGLFNLECRKAK